MYGLIDCNNFFVSCERVFDPRLNGKTVVVLSNNDGCVIARSNEAKAAGIPMGCPAFKIKEYTDPRQVVQLSARHILYRDLSDRVMYLMGKEVDNLQVYSVDEAFFRLPHEDVETSHRIMAELVKKIRQYVGIPVSIGFAPSRTLAKVANHIAKRDSPVFQIRLAINIPPSSCIKSYCAIHYILKKSLMYLIGPTNLRACRWNCASYSSKRRTSSSEGARPP